MEKPWNGIYPKVSTRSTLAVATESLGSKLGASILPHWAGQPSRICIVSFFSWALSQESQGRRSGSNVSTLGHKPWFSPITPFLPIISHRLRVVSPSLNVPRSTLHSGGRQYCHSSVLFNTRSPLAQRKSAFPLILMLPCLTNEVHTSPYIDNFFHTHSLIQSWHDPVRSARWWTHCHPRPHWSVRENKPVILKGNDRFETDASLAGCLSTEIIWGSHKQEWQHVPTASPVRARCCHPTGSTFVCIFFFLNLWLWNRMEWTDLYSF